MIFLKICHIIIIQEIVIFSTIVVLRVMMIGFWCTTTEGVEVWDDIGWCAATKGVEVHIRKVAPLGDPVEVTVRGYELSLRKADAEMIEVE